MNERTDPELLRDYAERRSEAAFAELVRRHIDLVHSAALRMVRDPHVAEDVTQAVFVALARDARLLLGRPVLAGWLHRTAQNLAANVVRAEVRRRAREQEAATMNELLAAPSEPDWERIAPLLDEALGELSDPDRDALLLRYFERKSAHDMARLLGVSDEAAQKRVTRAVERLREHFAQRGITMGAGGLVAVIAANAVQAAPAGLALTISSTALAAATLASAATATTAKAIAMTTLQKTVVAATITVLAGAGIYEAREAAKLREQVASLRAEHAPLAEQFALLQREREDAARQLAMVRAENADLKHDTADLLRLRGEVTRLRTEAAVAATAINELQAQIQQAVMSRPPPVKTFTATAQTTTSWDQAIVTGGWRTPSGKRAIVLVTFGRLDEGDQLMINSRILEFSEEAGERHGLTRFAIDDKRGGSLSGQHSVATRILSSEEYGAVLEVAKDSAGVETKEAPAVTTLSGRQTEIAILEARLMPSGEEFSTGSVLNFIPTISRDGKAVEVVIAARLNYLVPEPLLKFPPTE